VSLKGKGRRRGWSWKETTSGCSERNGGPEKNKKKEKKKQGVSSSKIEMDGVGILRTSANTKEKRARSKGKICLRNERGDITPERGGRERRAVVSKNFNCWKREGPGFYNVPYRGRRKEKGRKKRKKGVFRAEKKRHIGQFTVCYWKRDEDRQEEEGGGGEPVTALKKGFSTSFLQSGGLRGGKRTRL